MLAKVHSASCIGIDAYQVEIEVDLSPGLPHITIVGLPDQAVKESKDRIKTAIKNSGFQFPGRRKIVINLAPADIKKEGPLFDLPIALGILAATGHVDREKIRQYCIVGEVALDGSLRDTMGTLSIALGLRGKHTRLIVPWLNAQEAALQEGVAVFGVKTVYEAVLFINGERDIAPSDSLYAMHAKKERVYYVDFDEVRGQQLTKRALEIAVSGGHNIAMVGPPGSGKTMLAKRLPSIFPDLTYEEALETTKIHSSRGLMKTSNCGVMGLRPFRSPHHTTSAIALAGGGSLPQPGEVSLAHNGVLFLDEMPEFSRSVLEVLRGPLEDGVVTIARAKQVLSFPANFMLVCAMNPCPCGFFGDTKRECHCSGTQIQKYLSKISGPLLDRIDIHIEVRRLAIDELKGGGTEESSKAIRMRVNAVREIQKARFKKYPRIYCNAGMGSHEIKAFCPLSSEAQELLDSAIRELAFSARAYHKILKVSRTIRDMKNSSNPAACSDEAYNDPLQYEDIAEALQYRSLDRNWLA